MIRMWLTGALLLVSSNYAMGDSAPNGLLVLQTDFGESDGAVAAMRGVVLGVDRQLRIADLTHDITPFDTWQAGYRLMQAAPYWPVGTVFVSVVDPGVGTERRSVVALAGGRYFVTPDNGTLTMLAQRWGIDALREIDERVNRRAGSNGSHTFHGRDVYVYTGARLAAGVIDFSGVGPELAPDTVVVHTVPAVRVDEGRAAGFVPVLDVRFGNVWTNIDRESLRRAGISIGDTVEMVISEGEQVRWRGVIPLTETFGDVPVGTPLSYINSLDNLALALNQGNFATRFGIVAGPEVLCHVRLVDEVERLVDQR